MGLFRKIIVSFDDPGNLVVVLFHTASEHPQFQRVPEQPGDLPMRMQKRIGGAQFGLDLNMASLALRISPITLALLLLLHSVHRLEPRESCFPNTHHADHKETVSAD